MHVRLGMVMLCALLTACSAPHALGGDPAIKVLSQSALPEPVGIDPATGLRTYLIAAYDKLTIDVVGIEEISKRDVQVDESGRISLPIAGEVVAAGHTPAELRALLVAQLRKNFLRDPQVSVNLKEAAGQVVTVDGSVREPGMYPVLGGMTLMRAIASAKGVSEFARLEDVVIFRTVAGQRYAALYNLQAIRDARYADPHIFADDVIVVGDSPSKHLFHDVLLALPALSAPLVVALQGK